LVAAFGFDQFGFFSADKAFFCIDWFFANWFGCTLFSHDLLLFEIFFEVIKNRQLRTSHPSVALSDGPILKAKG